MPISLEALKAQVDPKRTVLLLGAGASIPSGAPSSAGLAARLWREVAHEDPQSEDLMDTASVLERRYGRRPVVDEIVDSLKDLRPVGGILGIPQFDWSAVFTTNFDQLMEKAYKISNKELTAIRSNYDFTNREPQVTGTLLYKIHGCITQDRALGHKSSMIITEDDYADFERYRQTIFSTMQTMMLTNSVVVVGQSLRDRHLHDLIRKVLSLRQEGVESEVFVVVYDRDDLRAPLHEDKGARIVFGGIDEFVHLFGQDLARRSTEERTETGEFQLPISLVSTAHDVSIRSTQEPNVLRMFNGGPATFADIRAGATFERSRFADVVSHLLDLTTPLVAIVGAAGVGKTTFARQIALEASNRGFATWEHRNEFAFRASHWIDVEAELRTSGGTGVLLLDECTHYLRQANILVDALGAVDEPALRLIMTANAAQWTPRLKSPVIFRKGLTLELSRLDNVEINSLINLYQRNTDVGKLVDRNFRRLPRQSQISRLREKCGADMFVCLTNIFGNDNLDTILLTEFDELDESFQDYYRYVAALEAVGTRVHRQLLMRMLSIGAQQVSYALDGLSGIIDEYDIKPDLGIYGWSTRHIVIARKITDYKFSNFEELEQLFDAIIDNINPAIPIELQSIRDLCDTEFGIGRLGDTRSRQRLYRRLIAVAEGERIPWHRLVRELLEHGGLEDTEYALRSALDAVGSDGPLDRFKVRLLLARAERTAGINDEDRLALVRRAYQTAEANIGHHRNDKFTYRALCEVAVELVRRGESPYILDEAITKFREAADRILDPEMDRQLRHFEETRARM